MTFVGCKLLVLVVALVGCSTLHGWCLFESNAAARCVYAGPSSQAAAAWLNPVFPILSLLFG
jgi:hypothetical protein